MYSLDIFGQRLGALAEFGQRAQHAVKIGQVEEHRRVEQVCLPKLKNFMARAQEHFDVAHAQELLTKYFGINRRSIKSSSNKLF